MSITRYFLVFALPILVFSAAFAACDDDGDDSENTTATTPAETEGASSASGSITVFAASSLTDAFGDMGSAFTDANPDAEVSFNFAGSPELRTQLEQGASADLFASANTTQMESAVTSGVVVKDSSVFARNVLIVIVPESNDAGIETLQDLATPGIKLVLANADVPVGGYSRTFLENASADPDFGADYGDNVLANLVSEESNVKQVVAKVQLGEADAGIVYSSDVTGDIAGDVSSIEIPEDLNVIGVYPIAVTTDAANADTAQAFIDFLLSEEGQAILESHGFLPAES
jgi:molybdate transport system substrate-binding protein